MYTSKRQVIDGPRRTVHPACVRPHRACASKGPGKTPSWVHSRHTLANTEVLNTNACGNQQQATWHHDPHRQLSHRGPVWFGVHSQAGWKDCTRGQWSPESRDFQSDHADRSSHTCNAVASLPVWYTDYTCHHSHRLNEPSAKGGVWNGLPWLAHSHAQSLAAKTSVDLLPWTCPSLWEWTGR